MSKSKPATKAKPPSKVKSGAPGSGSVVPTTRSARLRWLDAPARHDYPAAAAFLNLVASGSQTDVLRALLMQSPTVHQAAKDILRAAGLTLLATTDPEVAKDLRRVEDGVALSPVLLVRGDVTTGRALVIADGYHRVCTSYHLGEGDEIPCRIVSIPAIAV